MVMATSDPDFAQRLIEIMLPLCEVELNIDEEADRAVEKFMRRRQAKLARRPIPRRDEGDGDGDDT
jgi:hypothetical protein